MSDEKLSKYDPRVQEAMREHFAFALEGAATGGPHFVIGVLMGACHLPEDECKKFGDAFEKYRDTALGRLLP